MDAKVLIFLFPIAIGMVNSVLIRSSIAQDDFTQEETSEERYDTPQEDDSSFENYEGEREPIEDPEIPSDQNHYQEEVQENYEGGQDAQ